MAQINKPSDYFNTITYTGNDTDGRTITGVGFQPDFSWVKARSSGFSHYIIDAIRYDSGASKYLKLDSSSTAADETPSGAGWISELNSDGYVCKNGTSNTNNCNENGVTYASWNWLGANGTSANTDGTISSTVSANTTSGFSIVSWTGSGADATIGHGLTQAPTIFIVKNRTDSGTNWRVGQVLTSSNNMTDGNGYYMELDDTKASTNPGSAVTWGSTPTAPTSSVFTVGSNNSNNGSSDNMIAYCFHSVNGYSKMGSYTGNGSTNGTFVYTGFKPAFVIVKRTSGADNWLMWDNKRNTSNATVNTLRPNTSEVENTSAYPIDFLSNGFKNRGTSGHHNTSGQTYIYMAFAEEPLVGTNNIPATAR